MIVQEHFELEGREFIRSYSDAGRYVVGGEPYGEYSEACDPADLGRTYVEGEKMPPEDVAAQAEEIMNILLGGGGE
jgi:hypothetical protein